ncbi:hypothetical protein MKX03_027377 [Papaver bracteatum]|nr:hypothetical protein MKX03_027377 [Papaver bracteatum]
MEISKKRELMHLLVMSPRTTFVEQLVLIRLILLPCQMVTFFCVIMPLVTLHCLNKMVLILLKSMYIAGK